MNTYCKLGDTDIFVIYSFGGSKPKTIKLKNAPINVNAYRDEIPNNYLNRDDVSIVISEVTRTWIRHEQPREIMNTIAYKFRNIVVGTINSIYIDPIGFRVVGDGYGYLGTENVHLNTSEGVVQGGSNTAENVSSNVIDSKVIYSNGVNTIGIRCESRTDNAVILSIEKPKCYIEIKYGNQAIYKADGTCPINYTVTCGEECPLNTLKCPSTNYPGYCCLPCEPIALSIKAIKNTIQSLNKSEVSRG